MFFISTTRTVSVATDKTAVLSPLDPLYSFSDLKFNHRYVPQIIFVNKLLAKQQVVLIDLWIMYSGI